MNPSKAREAGSNFRPAFLFLGRKRRKALSAVYAYARTVDDIADATDVRTEEKLKSLEFWKNELDRVYLGSPFTGLGSEIREAALDFGLKKEHFSLLLEGVGMDIAGKKYGTFSELESYMRRVASAVGFLCLDIFGYAAAGKEDYAGYLGYAVQLTNIIRDVYEDAMLGRIYLPEEDMRRFGVSPEDLKKPEPTAAYAELMGFEARRAHEFYAKADALADAAEKKKLLSAFIMAGIYEALLYKIERSGFKKTPEKPVLSGFEKMGTVLRAWRKTC